MVGGIGTVVDRVSADGVTRDGRRVCGVAGDSLDLGVLGTGAAPREQAYRVSLLGQLFGDDRADSAGPDDQIRPHPSSSFGRALLSNVV